MGIIGLSDRHELFHLRFDPLKVIFTAKPEVTTSSNLQLLKFTRRMLASHLQMSNRGAAK